MTDIFETGLEPGPANFRPLTPLAFLERAAHVWPQRTAVIHGDLRRSWRETAARCRRLALALRRRGIGKGDVVSVLAPNVPGLLEAHYGVPMAGAVLNALNIRLDAATIAFILDHAQSRVLIADTGFHEVVRDALGRLGRDILLVDLDEGLGPRQGALDYEALLAEGADEPFPPLDDEWRALSLCYTSGTTGNPKGAVYHHRGAYLNAIGNAMALGLDPASVYLWTLPMFHCNGWTHTWAVTAAGATHVCLRKVDPAAVFEAIERHRVTHLAAAPIVLNMLAHAPAQDRRSFEHVVRAATGGAAPPSSVIGSLESLGFRITHLYGLTETFGPATVCVPQDDWAGLGLEDRARLMARQGVGHPTQGGVLVADPETLAPVPADGATMGEILLRGNTVMKGYLKNRAATLEAFRGGWYHTGDLAVLHPDGYIEIRDRAKDVIISGGENISSLEVEEVLYRHPAVMEAAVVARPDDHWGETPCAFVTLRSGASATAEEIVDFCRRNLARYKVPRTVVLTELPKTSTGKIQKFVLRERAKGLG
jgi:fatty-acyl-CoA synthase